MMTELRIATRRSPLAMTQSKWVADRLTAVYPDLEIQFVEITTTGDIDRTSPVVSLTEMGAFVRAVQHAVLDGRADMAVHSCKDLPVSGPEELWSVYPERESPWDVLCGSTLAALPPNGRVGTGSPRRRAQLALLRPDLELVEIRGNVETRLQAVQSGTVDAVMLAEAGLRRLGRTDAITYTFAPEEIVPAPAQAALALETIRDSPTAELLAALEHAPTRTCVEAERALLAATGAGCRSALGAIATVDIQLVRMMGFVEDSQGPRTADVMAESGPDAARSLQAALLLGD